MYKHKLKFCLVKIAGTIVIDVVRCSDLGGRHFLNS